MTAISTKKISRGQRGRHFIVGQGVRTSLGTDQTAFLLLPIPEPATAFLLPLTLALFARRRHHRS